MKALNFRVSIPVSILKENKRYVMYTPVLDLSTSGRTVKEAKMRFSEAVEIFLEELHDKNTLDAALRDLGWHKVERKWQAPVVVKQGHEQIKIPTRV